MEIYDHYGLFEFDGKCFRLKNNTESLERAYEEKADIDILSIRDELHEFRFYLEMNKFIYREFDLPQLPDIFRSGCHLIDKETGLETVCTFASRRLPNNSEFPCYGMFGYLTLNKDKIKIHRDIPFYSEFLQMLSATLCDNKVLASLKGYGDDTIPKGIIFNSVRKDTRKFFLHNRGTAFKYVSCQYNKLQPELINLDLEYLVEIENSVLQTIEKQNNGQHLIRDFDKEIYFKDKLYKKTKLLEKKFEDVLDYFLTLAIISQDEDKLRELSFVETRN